MKKLIVSIMFLSLVGCATTQAPKPTSYYSKEQVDEFYADKKPTDSVSTNFVIDVLVFGSTFLWP